MNQDELIKLRDCVKGGDLEQAAFWKVWEPEADNGHLAYVAHRAAYGSLDAAKELHDAALPACNQYSIIAGLTYFQAKVCTWPIGLSGGVQIRVDERDDCYPSRAWLIAILSALSEGEA